MANTTRSAGRGSGVGPYDTSTSSGLRFLVELVAWVAGPWAAADLSGSGWAAVPAAAILLALPSIFNTPGDKNVTGVATPGPVRIGIEALLLIVAVGAAWIVWPAWVAVFVTLAGMAMVATGVRRYRWLAAGAPPVGTSTP